MGQTAAGLGTVCQKQSTTGMSAVVEEATPNLTERSQRRRALRKESQPADAIRRRYVFTPMLRLCLRLSPNIWNPFE